ncbi:CheR family methyltransferase [Deinococcus humi]|uniref:protein-glutamate O-methyltransferase n=1 Tax=Deinococcus humi TaxID=662880 RepID=A0A7W8K1E5_9DEIO|nr:CheR family methyltransferase [Deinococcus humi]MBB5365823.1 two-component system CheB/CheR fusion protein [Deinococcus humi]GGO39363.1 chemotaxis protein CheR [Deinococcus humi]
MTNRRCPAREPAPPGASIIAEESTPHPQAPLESPTRVVGISGSAGALDSYERFFLGLPPSTGMAFVVVPHLAPNAPGLMPDLLARCTPMPVVQITGSQPLRANHVYVIPPGHSLSLRGGTLRPGDLALAGGQVIDHFFESLAADQQARAVGIVLSGLGSDGTRGIGAIKRLGGRVLIEDPQTAEYPDMPRSAAATGLADNVLPAPELAVRLMGLAEVPPLLEEALVQGGGESGTPLQTILRLVRAHSGHDFTLYKRATLIRRIDRRMKGRGIGNVADYVQVLETSPDEIEALFQDFTINVTSFFRDTEAFEALKIQLRSVLQGYKQEQDTFRVWVTACSTGEEAYSLAIVLHELITELAGERTGGPPLRVQIFATDIDPVVVNTARQGLYPKDIAYVVSEERLQRFFQLVGNQYQVRGSIRDSVVFATHSTFADPPFTRLDLVSCRNLLIYIGTELQRQILELFRYALRPAGLLFLGASESIGPDQQGFTALDRRWKIYRRDGGEAGRPPLNPSYPPRAGETPPGGGAALKTVPTRIDSAVRPDLAPMVQDALLAEYAPPAVVVSGQGEVLFVHGRTGRYLELPPGQVQNSVFEMVPVSLRLALRSAVREAHHKRRRVTYRGLVAMTPGEFQTDGAQTGKAQTLDLTVRPLQPASDGPLLVTFQQTGEAVAEMVEAGNAAEAEGVSDAGHRLALELELRHGREALRATVEEMACSVEDLRISHEELQTSHEELQSANEELMTSKEELQSLNEELSTVNAEHQVIIQDQARANDDLNNLLDTAGTAILFLGNDLTIRRFTAPIGRLVRLTPADVGRPLGDFHVLLRQNRLVTDIQRVLNTLEPHEAQVQTQDGAWFLLQINPYRTSDNRIDGVVVALTSIAVVKALEWQLVESLNLNRAALDAKPDPLLLLDQHLRAVTASQALLTLLEGEGPGTGNLAFDVPVLSS